MGQGSMTGRGFGFCSGNDIPGFENGFGGLGRRGRGFGRRNFWNWPFSNSGMLRHRIPDREEEVKMLKSQAESLKNSQKDIERRLGELEKKD